MTVRYTDFKSFDGPADTAILNPNRGLDSYANGVNTYRGKLIADQATIIEHIDSGIQIMPKNGYIYYAPTAEQLLNVGGAQEDSDCILAPEWQALFEAKASEILNRL